MFLYRQHMFLGLYLLASKNQVPENMLEGITDWIMATQKYEVLIPGICEHYFIWKREFADVF